MSKTRFRINQEQLAPRLIIITALLLVLINIATTIIHFLSVEKDPEVAPDTEAVKIQQINQAYKLLQEKTLPIDKQN